MSSPYDAVAREYFSMRHRTCRNFDTATKSRARHHLSQLSHTGPYIEVGAGIGRLREYTGLTAQVHVDSSIEMLNLRPREPALRVHADARQLPFVNEEFGLLAAFLCDPFLDQGFIDEAARVIKSGGIIFLSTPAYEWAVALRGGEKHETVFVTENNQSVVVPSLLHTQTQLLRLLGTRFADLQLTICTLPREILDVSPAVTRAAQVAGMSEYELPLVYLVSGIKHG